MIYGVCDRLSQCNSYFGFFKDIQDAKDELKIQVDRLRNEFNFDVKILEDKAVIPSSVNKNTDRTVIAIHQFILR